MVFVFGECELDLQRGELRQRGEPRHVEPQVFAVLAYLVEHRDRLVSKEELLERVWQRRFVTPATLNSRLKAARRAIGDDGKDQQVIRTIRGRGFRFVAPVVVRGASPEALSTPAPGAAAASTARLSPPAVLPQAISAPAAPELIARSAELAADAAVTPRQAAAVGSHTSPAPRSIAVLPFANMSADSANEFFTDGIAEEITNALVKIQALRVAARTSAFAYKGKSLDIRQIGQQLGVDTLLEGSVRKGGSRLRISAQLINVADGYHLWSERYDREVEDVFAIQDEIAQNVAQALRIVLSEHERRAMSVTPAADVRAYEYYLRGRQLAHQHRRKSYEHALQMFARAIEIDPGYARAYAGMADCYCWLYMYLQASEANLERADAASRKALELDPDSAEAHASRGHAISLSKRFDEAHAEFETAIRLTPTLFEAHYLYARACWAQGLLEEAARHFKDACEVRPEDYQAPCLLGTVYDGLGEREKADRARRRALTAARRHLELYPDDVRALYLGAGMLRQLGAEAEAIEWASRVLATASDDPPVYYNLACFYALGGDPEEALGCLERAVELGYAHREWLEHDTDLVSLREHPRYAALLRQLS